MIYYKATVDMYDRYTGCTTVANELVTRRERTIKFKGLPDYIFKKVNRDKRDTYKSHGIRFETQERTRKSDKLFFEQLEEEPVAPLC